MESIELDTISREISDSVAGYIVHGPEELLGLISGLKTGFSKGRIHRDFITEALGDVVA